MSHPPHRHERPHSGLRSFGVGASVVVDGRIYDVMEVRPTGDVLLQDAVSREFRWCDYYICRLINPNENPGALLDAMGTIADPKDE